MRAKGTGFLLLLVVSVAICAGVLAQSAPTTTVQAGLLQTFLTHTKNARTLREALGSLTATGLAEARFEAIVAWDGTNPGLKVRGLEVRLRRGEWKTIAYLDDDRNEEFHRDSLKEFRDDLARLAAKGEHLWEGALSNEGMVSAVVCNRITPEQSTPRVSELSAGRYKEGSTLGVAISTAQDGPVFFPGSDLATLVEIIDRGRAFLASH